MRIAVSDESKRMALSSHPFFLDLKQLD